MCALVRDVMDAQQEKPPLLIVTRAINARDGDRLLYRTMKICRMSPSRHSTFHPQDADVLTED